MWPRDYPDLSCIETLWELHPLAVTNILTLFSPLLNKENRHASALVLINSILEYCPHYSMYTVEYEDCFKLCALFLLAERGTKSETRAGR